MVDRNMAVRKENDNNVAPWLLYVVVLIVMSPAFALFLGFALRVFLWAAGIGE